VHGQLHWLILFTGYHERNQPRLTHPPFRVQGYVLIALPSLSEADLCQEPQPAALPVPETSSAPGE